ncbi:MAG: carboxypeptidase M32 [Gemmatimonadaceae bacterium]|nr:carboxypeptidase M32 [Chitinophagaceae bacterium]
MEIQKLYQQYRDRMQKIADLRYSNALLQWDQEVYMPSGGNAARSRQIATLSELAHEMFTDDTMKSLLAQLSNSSDLNESEKKNIALTSYDFSQQEKLPTTFVRELSEATSLGFEAWIEARNKNDFRVFEKQLSVLVELKKKEAALLGFVGHPYDALLNQYERGATVAMIDKTFARLEPPLSALLEKIRSATQIDDSFLHGNFSKDQQWKFGMEVLRQLGYDFNHGRQDISEHPFTVNMSAKDVRITTRIDEKDFSSMTWSCVHEFGHALYEQGLPDDQYGLPLGEAVSLSIHESQSRLWENNVGRSMDAWHYFLPVLKGYFPDDFAETDILKFYKGINKVQPSLIRTEADELTYHFHVMIRYDLEKKLIGGELKTADIPAYWNEQYSKRLGVKVPDDKQGCLQDVHWSHGSFGYFPTYSLGSLYAAQIFSSAVKNIPGLAENIRNGDYKPLSDWLRISVHQHGREMNSEDLCRQITGEPLNIQYFLDYAVDKYKKIYEF